MKGIRRFWRSVYEKNPTKLWNIYVFLLLWCENCHVCKFVHNIVKFYRIICTRFWFVYAANTFTYLTEIINKKKSVYLNLCCPLNWSNPCYWPLFMRICPLPLMIFPFCSAPVWSLSRLNIPLLVYHGRFCRFMF